MSSISVLLSVKRRLGQISRRAKSGPILRVGPLSDELHELLGELGVSASKDPEFAVELALSLLEQLPSVFLEIDDKEGLLGEALDRVPTLLVELLNQDFGRADSALDRPDVLERIFNLWMDDESGYLKQLDRTLLCSIMAVSDETAVLGICQRYLRDLPLVFPALSGEKLDIERQILRVNRYAVDKLVGEIHIGHGRSDHLILTTGQWMRETGDAVDHIDALELAGLWEDALSVARGVLRDSNAPRREAVRMAYERIASHHSKDALELKQLERRFLADPDWKTWSAVLDVVPTDLRADYVDDLLNILESHGEHNDFCFQLYVEEGMILEADGLAAHQPIRASVLSDCAELLSEEHPDCAAGWFLMAAYSAASRACRASYVEATRFLTRVRDLSAATNQSGGFLRALKAFREHNKRRRLLLKLLDEQL